MTVLSKLLSPDRIVAIQATEKNAALRELVGILAASDGLADRDALYQAILDREDLMSTGIGFGLAIPHAKVASVKHYILALGISKEGIPYGSIDDRSVHILVMVVGPEGRQEDYLRILAKITRFLKAEREKILNLDDPKAILELTRLY